MYLDIIWIIYVFSKIYSMKSELVNVVKSAEFNFAS